MILPWLVLIPFIGGLLCWQAERFSSTLPRWLALLTMSLVLVLSLWLWISADYSLAGISGGARYGPWSSTMYGSPGWASTCIWRWMVCPC